MVWASTWLLETGFRTLWPSQSQDMAIFSSNSKSQCRAATAGYWRQIALTRPVKTIHDAEWEVSAVTMGTKRNLPWKTETEWSFLSTSPEKKTNQYHTKSLSLSLHWFLIITAVTFFLGVRCWAHNMAWRKSPIKTVWPFDVPKKKRCFGATAQLMMLFDETWNPQQTFLCSLAGENITNACTLRSTKPAFASLKRKKVRRTKQRNSPLPLSRDNPNNRGQVPLPYYTHQGEGWPCMVSAEHTNRRHSRQPPFKNAPPIWQCPPRKWIVSVANCTETW